jgi:hypothetical protein
MLNHEKHYFVFTDSKEISGDFSQISLIEQEKLGWPHDTLKRFHMFKKIESDLNKFDFLIFFNANVCFIREIGDEYLPTRDEGLLLQLHPGFYNKFRFLYTFERRSQSTAYIPYWKGRHYVFGAMSGGWRDAYMSMINELCHNIDIDEKNNIIAVWHDESHLNKYALKVRYKLLHPGYMYPEEMNLPFEKQIKLRDKKLFGGHDYLRA